METGLHRPSWKGCISGMAMEKRKGAVIFFFGMQAARAASLETTKGDADCCGRHTSVKSSVKRQ